MQDWNMEKTELIKFLHEVFKPLSFKKKNNTWSIDNGVLIKKLELQKSYFGNYYYLNYGIIFKGLDYNDVRTHVYKRLAGATKEENKEINSLLNLDHRFFEIERKDKLQFYINDKIINYFNRMNNEEDVKIDLKDSSFLDMVTVTVRKYLQLD